MAIKNTIEKWNEKFEEESPLAFGGRDWAKSFMASYTKDLLQSVVEWAKENDRPLEDIYTEEEIALCEKLGVPSKTPEYMKERKFGYNQALNDLSSYTKDLLQSVEKEIAGLKRYVDYGTPELEQQHEDRGFNQGLHSATEIISKNIIK